MRSRLIRALDSSLPEPPVDSAARPVAASDAPALARLMLDAYRGTVDDAGEGPDEARAEVDRLLSGGYGPFDTGASELIERDGGVIAATLVTTYEGAPMIAFSMTIPAWQRRGLARAGLLRAMSRLRAAGATTVRLAVTDANTPAFTLYRSLGFVRG